MKPAWGKYKHTNFTMTHVVMRCLRDRRNENQTLWRMKCCVNKIIVIFTLLLFYQSVLMNWTCGLCKNSFLSCSFLRSWKPTSVPTGMMAAEYSARMQKNVSEVTLQMSMIYIQCVPKTYIKRHCCAFFVMNKMRVADKNSSDTEGLYSWRHRELFPAISKNKKASSKK